MMGPDEQISDGIIDAPMDIARRTVLHVVRAESG
jgi:hypothetical protein